MAPASAPRTQSAFHLGPMLKSELRIGQHALQRMDEIGTLHAIETSQHPACFAQDDVREQDELIIGVGLGKEARDSGRLGRVVLREVADQKVGVDGGSCRADPGGALSHGCLMSFAVATLPLVFSGQNPLARDSVRRGPPENRLAGR